jgi:hypothetical protein
MGSPIRTERRRPPAVARRIARPPVSDTDIGLRLPAGLVEMSPDEYRRLWALADVDALHHVGGDALRRCLTEIERQSQSRAAILTYMLHAIGPS